MSAVRCAVGLPNIGEYGDPRLLVELAGRAESAGWDGVFVWDHLAYHDRAWPVADPYVTVAAIAATTARIRLGVLVSAVARRRPWKLAREFASLDHLSGGRLVIGAGLGSAPAQEFAAFGEDAEPRVRAERLDEGLEIVAGLLTGEPFSYAGRHYHVSESLFVPGSLQRPRPPIWIAGRWPARRPFRRAARFDGVFPTFEGVGHAERPSAAQLAEVVAYVTDERDDPAAPFDVIVEAQSDGPAPELVDEYAAAGLTWWIEKLGWFRGSVDEVRERIERGPPA